MRSYHRRDFLKLGMGFIAGTALPLDAMATVIKQVEPPRNLAFYNVHTDERIKLTYFEKGQYIPEALTQINHILRDHRTGEISPIDTDLLDLLFDLKGQLSCREYFNVISGYRSPETNAKLRRNTRGVAKQSYHMRGKAIDIRIPKFDTARLRRLCIKLKGGGVGYYPDSDFVHVDVGPVRTW